MAPLEMNAETCWGKNTIEPRGRGIEKPREVTLTFFNPRTSVCIDVFCCLCAYNKHPVFVVCSDVFKLNLGAFDRPNLHSSKRVISLNKCRTKERRVSDIKDVQWC
jgi:hypothetical protein